MNFGISALPKRLQVKICPDSGTGCWIWLAAKDRHGYGQIVIPPHSFRAHRIIYEMLVEAIPNGLQLHHTCENRGCVNPDHLCPVTRLEHAAITIVPWAKYCEKGHAFTPQNIIWERRSDRRVGWSRRCRICRKASARFHWS